MQQRALSVNDAITSFHQPQNLFINRIMTDYSRQQFHIVFFFKFIAHRNVDGKELPSKLQLVDSRDSLNFHTQRSTEGKNI